MSVADMDYQQFIQNVKNKIGIDLSYYKETQMKRRLTSLREKRGYSNFNDYFKSLSKDEKLYEEFLDRVTINVSEFFRNFTRWEVLREKIIPQLPSNNHLKCWSSACSTGEEPFSLAMLFKYYYPKYHGKLPFDIFLLMDFFLEQLIEKEFNIQPFNQIVTFQDPCRLGRLTGEYDLPRRLLSYINDIQLVEMERSRENSICCGTSAWQECSGCSKSIQIQRLEEAYKTGASTLITACPKCQTHLTCALNDVKLNLQIKDIHTYLSERIDHF